jgi:ubiquinone/menaquinone biosynthesis C-methylase UbiE
MDAFNVSVQKFDEFAEEYASRFMNIDSYIDSVDKFCESPNVRNPKILELACGPGNFTQYLQQKFPGSSIIAIDLAPKMIDIAKKLMPDVDFRVMDVRDISSLDEKFDLIMCSFCLPFLSKSDSQKLIADCAQLLSKGGKIYISTMEGDESKAGYEKTSFSGSSEVYFNYHRQKDIEDMFKSSGFNLDYLKRQDYKEPDGTFLTDMIFIGSCEK